jgi:hypothetical protein
MEFDGIIDIMQKHIKEQLIELDKQINIMNEISIEINKEYERHKNLQRQKIIIKKTIYFI